MRHDLTRVRPYTPDQLFDLVGDVARYPEFVPWITGMRTTPAPAPAGQTAVIAEARVGFSFLTERFTTRVVRDPARRTIAVTLVNGPFRHLDNSWRFEPDARGCRIIFHIDFQFKTRVLDLMLKTNFGRAVDRLIACFEARAQSLYGDGALVAAETTSQPVSASS